MSHMLLPKSRMTPIKVKGKKGPRKRAWQPPDPEYLRKKQQQELLSGSSGGSVPTSKRQRTRKPAGAPIEQLPPEIIERIFHASQNLAFPRCSLRIGRLLSARTFLLELVVVAFGPTWDVWFGCTRAQVVSYVGWERDVHRFGGNCSFQRAVLACRWMSWAAVVDAQKIWFRRHGAGRHFEREIGVLVTQGVMNRADEIWDCFEEDWADLKDGCEALLFAEQADGRHDRRALGRLVQQCLHYTSPYFDIHFMTKIPDYLIGGPFSWDRAKLLFWLIRAGATMDDDQTWELARRGFNMVMILEDPELILVMLRLFGSLPRFFDRWPDHVLKATRGMAAHALESGGIHRTSVAWELTVEFIEMLPAPGLDTRMLE
ncbi:hypothetical protein B0T25DRAFT_492352 [Lasiosphaeria hispida]|uniref:Uncharacterized protein n=1 Tax=Lasiosphaeria hispida TaxID=260671 RepID=A0AAJ0HV85_9PEZI|nr:hypothetical protein B0T25DRAFT_492352 [Lasiosphaeria hispida]